MRHGSRTIGISARRRRAIAFAVAAAASIGLTLSCGRSELFAASGASGADDGGSETGVAVTGPAERGIVPTPIEPAGASAPDAVTPNSVCEPTEEVCNGVDDDCNDVVDDLSPIPCAEGGAQYCVAGAWSECPRRCQACLPGSERICFVAFCSHWAVQTCAADGRAFGACREVHVPQECESVSIEYQDSPELEQCCIDNGYCCRDSFDLDGDGNRAEVLGDCEEVQCSL